jgi:hypothetical protein
VVELKDGTRLIGEIAATKECVTIRTPLGTLEVPALDVARPGQGPSCSQAQGARCAAATKCGLADGRHVDLQHGLYRVVRRR